MRQRPNFTSTYRGVNVHSAKCLNSVLNVKALEGAFNQEKALVGAFSVIVKTDGSFAALVCVRSIAVYCSADVMVRRRINVHRRLCKLIQLANLHTRYLEARMAIHYTF